jgi:hypothetical protein
MVQDIILKADYHSARQKISSNYYSPRIMGKYHSKCDIAVHDSGRHVPFGVFKV